MPAVDAGAPGNAVIATTRTEHIQDLDGVADSGQGVTKGLAIAGMGRITVIVRQTAGAPGLFRLEVQQRGETPVTLYATVVIGALNTQVVRSFHIGARSARVRVFGPAAGGPHDFEVRMMATATS